MSNAIKKRVPVVLQGGAAYAANGQFQADLSAIQPIGYSPGGVTYLQGLLLQITATIANASGGDVTLGGYHVFDLIEQLQISVPNVDPLLDIPSRAGSAMKRLEYALNGKRGQQANNGGSLVVTNGGTLDVRLFIPVMFEHPRAINPGDAWIPLQNLREGSQLLGTWGNGASGGIFAASVTVSSATLAITGLLVEIPEYRATVWRHVRQVLQPGADNQIMGLNGRVVHQVIEIPAQAGAQVADSVLTAAQRTQVELEIDGRKIMERMLVAPLVADYMREWSVDDSEIFEPAANTMPFVPSLVPTNVQPGYKVTQLPLPRANPIYRVQGTATTPTLLLVFSDLNTSQRVLNTVRESSIALPSGFDPQNPQAFMRPKTESGFAAPKGSEGAARVPAKLYPEGVS